MYLCNQNNHAVNFHDKEHLTVQPLARLFDPSTGQVAGSGTFILFIADDNAKLMRKFTMYVRMGMLSKFFPDKTVKNLPLNTSIPIYDIANQTTIEMRSDGSADVDKKEDDKKVEDKKVKEDVVEEAVAGDEGEGDEDDEGEGDDGEGDEGEGDEDDEGEGDEGGEEEDEPKRKTAKKSVKKPAKKSKKKSGGRKKST